MEAKALPENVDMQLLIIKWSKFAFDDSTRMPL